MNIAGSLNYDTKIDTKGLKKGADEITSKSKGMADSMKIAVGNIIAELAKLSAKALGTIIETGLQYNKQIEKYQTALTTLTGSAEKANAVIEQIKKDAAATPFDINSLVSANQLLISAGVSADRARTDILNLGNAISATGGGSEELARMAVNLQQIKNIGQATALDIKQFAFAGIDVYGLLADATGKSRKEVSKMKVTYNDLTKALAYASQEGGKYAGAMEAQSKTVNGLISTLKDNLSAFAGKAMEPLFNLVRDDVLPTLLEIIRGGENVDELLDNLIDKITEFIMNSLQKIIEMLPKILEIGLKIAKSLIEGLAQQLPQMIPVILNVIGELAKILIDNADDIIMAGVAIIVALADGLTSEESIKAVIDAIPKIIMAIINALIELVPALVRAAVFIAQMVFSRFWEYTKEIVSKAWDKVKEFGSKIKEKITNFLKNAIDTVKKTIEDLPLILGYIIGEILGKIIKFGIDAFNWVKNDLPKIIESIIEWFKNLPANIWNALLNTIDKIVEWGKNLRQKGKDAAKELTTSVKDGVKELPSKMLEIGKNIVEGIWNGIKARAEKFKENVNKFFNGIVKGVKKGLGISSPSKVFANEIGQWIPKGVAVGIEANTESIDRAIDEINDNIIDRMTKAVTIEAGKSMYSGTNGTVTQMLSAFGTTTVVNENKLYLDGDQIYENQQTVSAKKNLQTQFGGGYSVSS